MNVIINNLPGTIARVIAPFVFALASLCAFGASTGEVTHVSGTLTVTRADGGMMVLGQKSEVFAGDMLFTQRDSYAQINFTDGSSVTMRPNTQLKLDAYTYIPEKPEGDNVVFRLLKGGLRSVTGLIGKRGNQDAYKIGTTTATIGIRGSIGDTIVCTDGASCGGVVKGGESLPPGTHHQTQVGMYTMTIGDKTTVIEEGHSGFSNGVEVKLTLGGIGGGKIDLILPGTTGLKGAAGCR